MVLANFNIVRQNGDQKLKKVIVLNLLEDMLNLHIRLCAHSFPENKQQLHKMSKQRTKSRSLRTEIKKQSSALETGH